MGVFDFIGGIGEHLGTGMSMVRDNARANLQRSGLENDLLKQQTQSIGLRQQLEIFRQAGGFETDAGRAIGMKIISDNPQLSKLMPPNTGENAFKSSDEIKASAFTDKVRDRQEKVWGQQDTTFGQHQEDRSRNILEHKEDRTRDLTEHGEDRSRKKVLQGRQDETYNLGLTEHKEDRSQLQRERTNKNSASERRTSALDRLSKDNPDAATAIDLGFVPDSLKKDIPKPDKEESALKTITQLVQASDRNRDANGQVVNSDAQALIDQQLKVQKDKLDTVQTLSIYLLPEFAQYSTPQQKTAAKERLSEMFHNSPQYMESVLPDSVAGQLAGYNNRKKAISDGAAVIDTGDGVATTPKQIPADLSPDDQAQFVQIEKAAPELDIRSDYAKDPTFYKKLFQAIRDGVPDNKGGKRKLTQQEIITLIKG